mmetsp:Transcript_10133/g.15363  ORF Transcript_10133/g.15363 Transcript_10133/m.15363 type:complete len:725 (+) Transcript_10133:58-2232(+)
MDRAHEMPNFDRVRENFLKRVESGLASRNMSASHNHTSRAKNLFVMSVMSLGYLSTDIDREIFQYASRFGPELDGLETTLEFMEYLFEHLNEEHPSNPTNFPCLNPKSEKPFDWPLVDMADYEFGSSATTERRDMKCVVVVTGLPPLHTKWVSRMKDFISHLFLRNIGQVKSVCLPLDSSVRRVKGIGFIEMATVSQAWHVYEALDHFCWPLGCGKATTVLQAVNCTDSNMHALWKVQMFKNYGRTELRPSQFLANTVSTTMNQRPKPRNSSKKRTKDGVGGSLQSLSPGNSRPDRDCQRLQVHIASHPPNCDPSTDNMDERVNISASQLLRAALKFTKAENLSDNNVCISSDRYQHVGVSNVEVTKSEQVEDTDMVNMGHLERSLQSSDSNSSVDSETESDNVSQNYSAPIGISHEVGTTRSQGEKLKGRYVSLQETNSDDNDEVREFDDNAYTADEFYVDNVEGDDSSVEEIMSDNSKRQLADELKQKVSDLVQSMNTLRSNLITAMGGGYICRRHNGSSSFDEAWVKADADIQRALEKNQLSLLLQAEQGYTESLQLWLPEEEQGTDRSNDSCVPDDGAHDVPLSTLSYILRQATSNVPVSCDFSTMTSGSRSVAEIHVMISTLRTLALTGWIRRSEQRMSALRRLYHDKAARAVECEDQLVEALEKTRKYTSQMNQLQGRINELQESLSYHRVAADRIRYNYKICNTEDECTFCLPQYTS